MIGRGIYKGMENANKKIVVSDALRAAYRACRAPGAGAAEFIKFAEEDQRWLASFGSRGLSVTEYQAAITAMEIELQAEIS